jgi:beta-N-acetylhexosaminidase
VTISDSLGSRAIRRFYDPREEVFRGHLVARDAFLAGNDLLLLSNFLSTGDADEATSIQATLAFFADRYREDSLFAERVDEAAERILELKLRLYGGSFEIAEVLPEEGGLARIGQGDSVVGQVALSAATLINPTFEELDERLGAPPRLGERIVFITDVRLASQCSRCEMFGTLPVDALEAAVLRLYGPGGEVGGWNLASYTMADLATFLGENAPATLGLELASAETMEEALSNASWLVFSVLGSSEQAFGSNALRLLLDRRPDIAQRSRVVVFSFGAPYDLDATDLSKIDVYYGLFSKSAPFVEVAARLLFQELTPSGAPPVTVDGIGYDLIEITSPDPDQVIPVFARPALEAATPQTEDVGYTRGDLVHVETGIIFDHNGHPVPDNTVVEFNLAFEGEGLTPMVLRATTVEGIASVEFALERFGLLVVSATSDPARTSEILQLNVQEGLPAFVTVIAPTPVPTERAAATDTPPAMTATPEGGEGGEAGAQEPGLGVGDLLLGLIAGGGVAWGGDRLVHGPDEPGGARRRRWLLTMIGGLLAYNYLALGLPGAEALQGAFGWLAAPLWCAVGGAAGIGVSRRWRMERDEA